MRHSCLDVILLTRRDRLLLIVHFWLFSLCAFKVPKSGRRKHWIVQILVLFSFLPFVWIYAEPGLPFYFRLRVVYLPKMAVAEETTRDISQLLLDAAVYDRPFSSGERSAGSTSMTRLRTWIEFERYNLLYFSVCNFELLTIL